MSLLATLQPLFLTYRGKKRVANTLMIDRFFAITDHHIWKKSLTKVDKISTRLLERG